MFDNAWVKEGFQNWKKGPKEHIESNKHVDAMALWEMYRDKKVKGESVLSQLSTANSEARRVTREWIKFVAHVLRFCATQESP